MLKLLFRPKNRQTQTIPRQMFDVFFIVFDHFVGLVLKKVTHFTRMLENDTKLGNH